MRKLQNIALLITILFCLDYSVAQLLGFELLFTRIHDTGIPGKLYAFMIGVCAFLDILSLKSKQEE